jgi:DNA damage-inducible protein 1
MTLADLKAFIHSEINVPPTALNLFYNNQLLTDNARSLEQVGVGPEDMLGMHIRARGPQQGESHRTGGTNSGTNASAQGTQGALSRKQQQESDPETTRLRMLGDPHLLQWTKRHNPDLAGAAEDAQRFQDVFFTQKRREGVAVAEREARIAMLNADPFNLDSQREIEEIIRQNEVTENLHTAMEYNPECKKKLKL